MTSSSPQNLIDRYQEQLRASPTAYAPNVSPTRADLQADKGLREAQKKMAIEESEKLDESWYGQDDEIADTQGEKRDGGLLDKILHVIGTPLYASVGVAEAALGKGTKKGLFENVAANVKERGTYGDLLRSYNAPGYVSTPLGFVLDVALDPLSWATLGTSAIVPRVGYGLVKGGLKGAKTAGLSGMAGKTQKVLGGAEWAAGRAMRIGSQADDPAVGRIRKALASTEKRMHHMKNVVGEASKESVDDWYGLTGGFDHVLKGSLISQAVEKTGARKSFGKFFENNRVGQSLVKLFGYSPTKWFRKKADEAIMGPMDEVAEAVSDVDDPVEELLRKGREATAKGQVATDIEDMSLLVRVRNVKLLAARNAIEATYDMMGEGSNARMARDEIQRHIETIIGALKKGSVRGGKVSTKEIDKFLDLAGAGKEKQMESYLNLMTTLSSEVQSYDQAVARILLNSGFRNAMSAYAKFIGLFKTAKISASPTPYMNAIVGNVAMTSMAGIDILSAGFMDSMSKAVRLTAGRDYKEIIDIFGDPQWSQYIDDFPDLFRSVTGVDPMLLRAGDDYVNAIDSKVGGMFTKAGNSQDLHSYINQIKDIKEKAFLKTVENLVNQKRIVDSGGKVSGLLNQAKASPSFVERNRIVSELTSLVSERIPSQSRTTFFADEQLLGEFGSFVRKIKNSAENETNPLKKKALKALSWYLTEPANLYSKTDQTYKLGVAMHLTEKGLSEGELRKLASRFNSIKKSNVRRVESTFYLKPEQAMEVANEIYMNYLAMPSAVKIMRNLPIVGNSFISFAFGMNSHIGKASIHNPAFYNKVQFLLSEVSGEKSPLEKKALEGKYSSWLNRPGMVKIPWVKQNPLYLNMENMLPHYSVSLVTDPDRTYKQRYGDEIAAAIDKSVFFKEPMGQLMLDWIILPHMLGEAQGLFGQPLYPKDAGLAKKAGLAAAQGVEAIVPGAVGPLALTPGNVPQEVLQYVPSYRFRQLENALQGKTSIGKLSTSEAAEGRSLRVLAGIMGLPLHKINLDYVKVDED